ncbi:MAG: tetratricopeptide repeat protein [Candidatus Methanoperedens sp.]|nr:tetratricopeptide repeat protein [Candidatus Methanoperedens sp.]
MPENNKTEEFLQKLAPCIGREELEKCVEEAARVSGEMGMEAEELLDLSSNEEIDNRFAYVFALAATHGLEGEDKAEAYYNAGLAAQYLGRIKEAEEHYSKAIEANPNHAETHTNYANLLYELKKEYDKAEEHYCKAIKANPNLVEAHYSYANLLKELKTYDKAEEHYRKAIELKPNFVEAHSNYALLLDGLKRYGEAENHFRKAIEINPNLAETHFNYAILLYNMKRYDEAEENYRKAIEINPNLAEAHSNYALLLKELKRYNEAEKHYRKPIEINPNHADAHYNYAILLYELKRYDEAEKHYRKDIELNPNLAEAHGAYGLLLVGMDKRDKAWNETEKASEIFKESGRTADSHLAKAWFYHNYANKNLDRKKYQESSKDIYKAGEEYLKASETETVDTERKYAFEVTGNVCKAKSFIWKEHKNNQELVNDLKNASEFYKKVSVCPAGGTEEICGACDSVMEVFSQVLTALEEVVHNKNPSIRKEEWNEILEKSNEVYLKKGSEKGAALVAALKQLIKCVDELAYYTARKSSLQKKRLKECYKTLEDVSSKVEGGLRNITDPANDIIKNYAKKMGIPMPEEKEPDKPSPPFDNRLIKAIRGAVAAIILGIIASQLFEWKVHVSIWNIIKHTFFNQSLP